MYPFPYEISILLYCYLFLIEKMNRKTEQKQKVDEETVTEQGTEVVTRSCYFGHRGMK